MGSQIIESRPHSGTRILTRENSIGLVRFCAALSVIYGHSFSFGGFDLPWNTIKLTGNQTSEARIAVDIFFLLSGFLITKSYISCKHFHVFIWHRVLRIYPAMLICAPLMAIVVYFLTGYSDWKFIVANTTLIVGVDHTIGRAFIENPMSLDVNGALWTLPWEIRAYLFVGIIGVLGGLKWKRAILCTAILMNIVFIATILSFPGRQTSPAITSGARLMTFFIWGMVFYLYENRIPMRTKWAVFAGLLLLCLCVIGKFYVNYSGGLFYIAGVLPLGYVTFFGAKSRRFSNVFRVNDVSYGIYIYGTFVLVVMSFMEFNNNWLTYLITGTAITLFLASLSWRLIERPALGLKSRIK